MPVNTDNYNGQVADKTVSGSDEPSITQASKLDAITFKRMAPYERGKTLQRIAGDGNLTLTTLSSMFGISVGILCRLMRLAECYRYLPPGWQVDLRTPPSRRKAVRPAIKYSHWAVVHAYFGKGGTGAPTIALMELASMHRWTAAKLKAELENSLREQNSCPDDSCADSAHLPVQLTLFEEAG